jgi:hypothetical protein
MINYPLQQSYLQDLPYPSNCEVYVFVGAIDDDLTSVNWKFWNKPKGTTMTYMLAIGGGGGGGRGFQRGAGGDGGGGGGGATGGIARLLIPSFFLPDVLYIRPGSGGEGSSTAAATGSNGGIAYVCYSQNTTAPNVLLQSSVAQAGGGAAGTGTVVGAAGAASAVSTISTGASIGLFNVNIGQSGGSGGAIAGGVGTSITAWGTPTFIPLSGGAGGGGSTGGASAGGAITATAATNFTFINWPTTAGAVATAGTNAGGRGNAGVNLWKPFRTSGASGGGTNDTTGGDGNSAGIGSGGGGGGAGATAGSGGNGGPGMVMIMSW